MYRCKADSEAPRRSRGWIGAAAGQVETSIQVAELYALDTGMYVCMCASRCDEGGPSEGRLHASHSVHACLLAAGPVAIGNTRVGTAARCVSRAGATVCDARALPTSDSQFGTGCPMQRTHLDACEYARGSVMDSSSVCVWGRMCHDHQAHEACAPTYPDSHE